LDLADEHSERELESALVIVEYSLRTSTMPIGVATYTTGPKLPKDYKKLSPDSKAISEKHCCPV
jgi:hypothetical protein